MRTRHHTSDGSPDALLSGLAEDIRAEVVLLELLQNELVDLDSTLLHPNGGFHRAVTRDLAGIKPEGSVEWAAERTVVEVNRKGVYDGLPEGVFIQPKRSKPFAPVSEVLDQIKRNNAIEEQARSFLSPIDHELLLCRLMIELNERRLTSELLRDRSGKGVRAFWNLNKQFSERELSKLLLLLPVAHVIAGDMAAMATALEDVLEERVVLRHTYALRPGLVPLDTVPMEDMRLGVDSILAGMPQPCERNLVISLGPMDRQKADTFAVGQSGYAKMELLLDLFLPADLAWELDIVLVQVSEAAMLGQSGSFSRLGLTSVLGRT